MSKYDYHPNFFCWMWILTYQVLGEIVCDEEKRLQQMMKRSSALLGLILKRLFKTIFGRYTLVIYKNQSNELRFRHSLEFLKNKSYVFEVHKFPDFFSYGYLKLS